MYNASNNCNFYCFQGYLRVLVTYHRFISFCLYIVGFVWFVLSLVKKYYMKQFSLFAWTHVALLIVVTQSYLIIQNIFEGLIWYVYYLSKLLLYHVYVLILLLLCRLSLGSLYLSV